MLTCVRDDHCPSSSRHRRVRSQTRHYRIRPRICGGVADGRSPVRRLGHSPCHIPARRCILA